MMTVHEVSRITGVSVRTLHHYDAIGLLRPSRLTAAGYRLYDDDALIKLQSILLFRELQFPLKDIRTILEHPDFDRREALEQQIKLLTAQREHIDSLIDLARTTLEKGESYMDFKPFDQSKSEEYAAEAKARWGSTVAYKAAEKKRGSQSNDEQSASDHALMAVFAEFGKLCGGDPASADAQALAGKLQDTITAHYYPCTEEILAGLGAMYTADERFRENIDRVGGTGTAEFASQAIKSYCERA